MIVARGLARTLLKSVRPASIIDQVQSKISSFVSDKVAAAPKLREIIDTLRNINYRRDFPQGLTNEQKKGMKRFDIFR
jgi:hypothetical protein